MQAKSFANRKRVCTDFCLTFHLWYSSACTSMKEAIFSLFRWRFFNRTAVAVLVALALNWNVSRSTIRQCLSVQMIQRKKNLSAILITRHFNIYQCTKGRTRETNGTKMFDLLQKVLWYISSYSFKGQKLIHPEHGTTDCKILHVNQIKAYLIVYTLSSTDEDYIPESQ